jgi:hypothetical protein
LNDNGNEDFTMKALVCIALLMAGFFSTGATRAFAQAGSPQDTGRYGRHTPAPAAANTGSTDPLLVTFHGTLRGVDKNTLRMDDPDGHLVQFYLAKKVAFYKDSAKIKWSSLKAGDAIMIEGRRGIGGYLEAVNVHVEPPPKP